MLICLLTGAGAMVAAAEVVAEPLAAGQGSVTVHFEPVTFTKPDGTKTHDWSVAWRPDLRASEATMVAGGYSDPPISAAKILRGGNIIWLDLRHLGAPGYNDPLLEPGDTLWMGTREVFW